MKRTKAFMGLAALSVGLGVFFSLVRNGEQFTADASKAPSGKQIATVAPDVAAVAAPAAKVATTPTNQTATVRGTLPFVLTSKRPIQKSLRLEIEAMGAKVVASRARNAVLVEATPEVRRRLQGDARFEEMTELEPSAKIQPELAALVNGGAKEVEVSIVAITEGDRATVLGLLAKNGGSLLKGCINEGDTIRAKLPSEAVETLSYCGEVRWMEQFIRPQLLNDVAVNEPQMNVRGVWEVHGLTGKGQDISTSDSGIDTGDLETMHLDLRNQVKDIQIVDGCIGYDKSGHGTHTAGSIVGDGTKSSDRENGVIRGTAYGAKLYAWFCSQGDSSVYTPDSVTNLYLGADAENNPWPAKIHSASWGSAVNGQYNSMCVDHDKFVWDHPEYLPVFAAGNEGDGASTVSSPGSSKNVLTVGATQSARTGHDGGSGNGDPTVTASFSSRGPCKDGRIKPDVSAPGVGILSTRSHGVEYSYGYPKAPYDEYYAFDTGTSMATPLTAGAVALVRQWLIEKKGFIDEDGFRPTAALMKAVIMGGAKDRAIPDNDQGWGRVDLGETLFPSNRAVKLVDHIPFAEGFMTNIVIETTAEAPLDVQLVWVDHPGDSDGDQTASRLVNDLDLIVEPVDAVGMDPIFFGNGGTGPDSLNNAESVHIANAPKAKYVITVDCRTILYDHTEGGAAALYIRGAFDPEATPTAPLERVHLTKLNQDFYTLDRALAAVCEDGETVTLKETAPLLRAVTLTNSCEIVCEDDELVSYSGFELTVAGEGLTASVTNLPFLGTCAGFVASDGATWSMKSIVFDDLKLIESGVGSTNLADNVVVTGSVSSIVAAKDGLVNVAGLSVTGDVASVEAQTEGIVRMSNSWIGGDVAALTAGGEVELSGVVVVGANPSDWKVPGKLTLTGSSLAEAQSVTVGADGNLTLKDTVAGPKWLIFEEANTNRLTLAGTIGSPVYITPNGACTNAAVFGKYTCNYPIASEAARKLYNIIDDGRLDDLAGEADSETGCLKWSPCNVPVADALCVVDYADGADSEGTLTLTRAMRKAMKRDSQVAIRENMAYTNALTLTHDLTLTSIGGKTMSFGSISAGFTIPEGKHLVITNLVVDGSAAKLKDCAFMLTGGDMTLENEATLSGFHDDFTSGRSYGGTVVVNSGNFTMRSGSLIEDCISHANGGAIWVGGSTAVANLFGGTITGCSAKRGGAVYAWGDSKTGSTVRVKGDFITTGNTNSDANDDNLFLARKVLFVLAGELTGDVGVAFGKINSLPGLNEEGANFVANATDLAPRRLEDSANRIHNDLDSELCGSVGDSGLIVWKRFVNDGQCEEADAGVRVKVDGEEDYRFYRYLESAFNWVEADATFEVRGYYQTADSVWERDFIENDVSVEHDIVLKPWADVDHTNVIWRASKAMYLVQPDCSLTLDGVRLYGMTYDEFIEDDSASNNGLISVEGGALTLKADSVVGLVQGSASRAANAISVWKGGTLTMEPGSMVCDSSNSHVDTSDATGCGGGILLDRSTAYFEGGVVTNCFAARAGGVYVANESTAYVSGGFTVKDNKDLDGRVNNLVVGENSSLILSGEFTGSIGVNEGIACETDCFAYVEWEYPSVAALTNSAAKFFHDFRNVRGTAVTNVVGDTVLVWKDSLSAAGGYVDSTGAVYKVVAVASGIKVQLPQALTLSSSTAANGKLTLSVDAVDADCWYVVYATSSLAEPFQPVQRVYVKKGETFTFEADEDPNQTSQFYKIVAE